MNSPEFKVSLHPGQLRVWNDPARFKICVAGRRWGKTRLAIYAMVVAALQSKEADVYYVAPTFEQGKRIVWEDLRRIAGDLIIWHHENTATCRMVNGIKIFICGSDRPDTLRGVPMAKAILDEYADMKPMVWKEIIRPALIDTGGGALFIGSPKGKNHFYELYKKAQTATGWACFQFKSRDNPFLNKLELEAIVEDYHGSTDIMRRELEASFESYEGALFKEEWLKWGEEPEEGDWHVAVDLAGFESTTSDRGKSGSRLDETVICATKTSEDGWFVGDFQHGRWDTRETATRILKTCRDFKPRALGIEEGALKNAVMPYLNEQMRTFGIYPRVEGLKHGGRNKTERIQWALQGRFEKGRVTLKEGAEWKSVFTEQYMDFPNPQAHDDMMDALAYVDQLAVPYFIEEIEQEDYVPADLVSGY